VTPVPPFDTTYTAAVPGTIAHGQPDIPDVVILMETGTANTWDQMPNNGYVTVDATNIYTDFSTLNPAVGAQPNRLRLIARPARLASVGVPDANTARTGSVTTSRQSFAGVKVATGGLSSAANVRASAGSGTDTLTDADNREQIFNLSAARTVVLPSTGVVAGEYWFFENLGAFDLKVQASGGSALTVANGANQDATIRVGFVVLRALVTTPTTPANWSVVNVYEQGSLGSLTFTANVSLNTGTGTPTFSRNNNVVTWLLPVIAVTTTTSDGVLTSSSSIPTRLCPAADTYCALSVMNSGGVVQTTPGCARVRSTQLFSIYRDVGTSTTYTAGTSGPSGINAIAYNIS